MATTQTQRGAGWNATSRGTQDAEQNAWSVEYVPLVVRRPVPVAEGVETGQVNFKRFRSNNATHAARTSQIQSSLDKERLESAMQNGAELLRYAVCSASGILPSSWNFLMSVVMRLQPTSARSRRQEA